MLNTQCLSMCIEFFSWNAGMLGWTLIQPEVWRTAHDAKACSLKPCTCPAYQWPHKPRGGGCDWPGPPKYLLLTLRARGDGYDAEAPFW